MNSHVDPAAWELVAEHYRWGEETFGLLAHFDDAIKALECVKCNLLDAGCYRANEYGEYAWLRPANIHYNYGEWLAAQGD